MSVQCIKIGISHINSLVELVVVSGPWVLVTPMARASRRVVLHRMSERGTPPAVKAALRRALRGLDGFGSGAVREGLRGHGAVGHDGPVPPANLVA
jgi:hypothetical protein